LSAELTKTHSFRLFLLTGKCTYSL